MHPNQANKLVAGNCEDTIQYNTKKLYCPVPGNSLAAFVTQNTAVEKYKNKKKYKNTDNIIIKSVCKYNTNQL